jgi:hypothetical protein
MYIDMIFDFERRKLITPGAGERSNSTLTFEEENFLFFVGLNFVFDFSKWDKRKVVQIQH